MQVPPSPCDSSTQVLVRGPSSNHSKTSLVSRPFAFGLDPKLGQHLWQAALPMSHRSVSQIGQIPHAHLTREEAATHNDDVEDFGTADDV